MNLKRSLTTLGLLASIAPFAFAQRATPAQMLGIADRPDFGTLHLQCNLGSFKIYGQGALTINFKGTVLVSKLKGNVSYTGAIKKEYEALDRLVLHGQGQVKVSGTWRAIQWFGSNMDAVWYGAGLVRISGEFDKDLKTGEYWFDDPQDKKPFNTFGIPIDLPERRAGIAPGVTPRKRGG